MDWATEVEIAMVQIVVNSWEAEVAAAVAPAPAPAPPASVDAAWPGLGAHPCIHNNCHNSVQNTDPNNDSTATLPPNTDQVPYLHEDERNLTGG
jgi:hypothetical protein